MMEDGSHLHELLEALEAGVLSLDRGGADPAAAIHKIFQSAHNLKSGLAMAGLERASKFFHGLEDGLDDIRRSREQWSAFWADAVLEAVDAVRAGLNDGTDLEEGVEFHRPAAGTEIFSPRENVDPTTLATAQAAGEGLYRLEKLFQPGVSCEDFEGHLVLEDIASVGTLVEVAPGWSEYALSPEPVVVRYLFRSPQSAVQLEALFFDPLVVLQAPRPRFRILIVEDDRLTARLLERTLKDFGEVEVSYDGAEGLNAFRSAFAGDRGFDLVVLDLELPEVNGHGVLQGLREHEEANGVLGLDRCLVFMNTSNSDLRKVQASFRMQADRYFVKPLSTEQIKKRLEETLPWLETRRRGST